MELYFTFELHKQQYSMDFHNNSREAKVYRITHTHISCTYISEILFTVSCIKKLI